MVNVVVVAGVGGAAAALRRQTAVRCTHHHQTINNTKQTNRHVPDQYTLIRTQVSYAFTVVLVCSGSTERARLFAHNKQTKHKQKKAKAYFPEREYAALQDALLAYGEATLGCRAISPIWLSYYVDGCVQELHADSFHGPFAFVLSLTRWEARRFEGGETAIVKAGLLDFWGSGAFRPGVGLEAGDIVQVFFCVRFVVVVWLALPLAEHTNNTHQQHTHTA